MINLDMLIKSVKADVGKQKIIITLEAHLDWNDQRTQVAMQRLAHRVDSHSTVTFEPLQQGLLDDA